MRAFETAGYIERAKLGRSASDDCRVTTVKGNALANASFGKPISRATAARLLAEVIERARSCNADPARLLAITGIVVFGSYPDPVTGPLGDLDLAVPRRRDTAGERYVDKVLEYARTSGRSFSTFHDRRKFWPARELRMVLKNRWSAVSITDEDIRQLGDRFEVAYAVGDDPGALPRHQAQLSKLDPAGQ